MIKNFLRNQWPKGHFSRSVATLATGTAVAQAIGMALTPVLTRLFSPEDFGITALWMSIVAPLMIFVCGRYEIAIVLPDEEDDAHNLVALALTIAASVSILVLLVVWVGGRPFASFVGAPALYPWLWFIPLSVPALGVFQTLNYLNIRRRRFRPTAEAQISQSMATNATQLAAGAVFQAGAGGLILGRLFGQMTAAAVLVRRFWREDRAGYFASMQLHRMRELAREFKRFPAYLMPSHLLLTLSFQLPVFFISHSSTSLLGLYGLATRLLDIPLTLLAASVSQVFITDAAREFSDLGTCRRLYRRTLLRLGGLAIISVVPVLFVGDSFYLFIFGDGWGGFAEVVRPLVPMYLIRFVASPLAGTFMVMRRNDLYFLFQASSFVFALGALWLGHYLGGGMAYVYAYAAAGSVVSLASLLVSFRLAIRGGSKSDA